ncbi:uncharacterized protein LOC115683898 [Syzygium oleosum]|uniref:uncharacterized protein LOC115683898 n=1 Tax=Syzygium oleosum TaxID=219896 RepID=UPI0024BA7455|nr:uncharacterized protein LOC115683898 [Syzygium oleosum]
MAYRRQRQQQQQQQQSEKPFAEFNSSSSSSSSSLAAKAIIASSAHAQSSLSSAYTYAPPSYKDDDDDDGDDADAPPIHSAKAPDEPKQGFWGALARKAKSILDDSADPPSPRQPIADQLPTPSPPPKSRPKQESPPAFQKGIGAIASSLNYIGNAVEEGINIVENRAANIIQETRKHVKKKPSRFEERNKRLNQHNPLQQPQTLSQMQSEQEIQLKASRDVAMAMAAKAKLLLRELKTVKADFAFAKERCAQLEEENKMLRETRGRGESPEDDDLVRLQLETLLAEKARLAHENSVYARENRFLREIVEYHQLTMQDVIYLDENAEEVNEVYPLKVPLVSNLPAGAASVPLNSLSSASPKGAHGTSQEATWTSHPSLLPEPVEPVGRARPAGS